MKYGTFLALALLAFPASAAETAPDLFSGDYRLARMDKLGYRVKEDPSRSGGSEQVSVSSSGQARFPVSRGFDPHIVLDVQGKTIDQVQAELKERLDAEYYHDATVDLYVEEASPILGQAVFYGASTGTVTLQPGRPMTVFDAIAQMGWLGNEMAKLNQVKIKRQNSATGEVREMIVDVQAMKETGNRSGDVPLQSGDLVQIPKKIFAW